MYTQSTFPINNYKKENIMKSKIHENSKNLIIKMSKNIILILLFVVGVVATNKLQAQTNGKITTTEIEVKGVCGMCKERIENAAYIKGVKKVEWDKASGILTVTYRNDKTTEDAIHKSIADAGHDTNKAQASEEAYKKLPGCCSYKDGLEKH